MQVGLGIAYLGLLWTFCSIARGKGALLFGLGVAALAWGFWKAGRGQRGQLYRAFFVVLLAAAGVIALEAILAFFPGVVSGRLANYTFGGYHGERDGIYLPHPNLGQAMRPSFRRRMFWNGHWWTHRTNEDGYRGERLLRADAVFLGDSMVYGHGVAEDAAVPAQLGFQSERAVANLGQPGIGVVQALILFREKGARLRPRQVFICLHPNDAQDSLAVYAEAELQAWLGQPQQLPLARPELSTPPPPNFFDRWERHVALPLRGARLISGLRGKPDWVFQAPAPGRGQGHDDGPFVPSHDTLVAPYAPLQKDAAPALRLAWQANRQALIELRRLASESGGELVIFDLGYPRDFTDAVESMAQELGATYNAAGRVALSRAIAGESIYLRDDGHWTPRACDVVASELLRRR